MIPAAFSPIIFYFVPYSVSLPSTLRNKANEAEVTAALAGKMQHGDSSLLNYTTVLEMASSVTVDTSVFVFVNTALVAASDSPSPGAEMQYLVLMDYGDRRTVIATMYANGDAHIWQRQIFAGVWRQSKWTLLATSTPPEEHDLPLAEGWSATEISSFSKDQFGRVHVAIHAIAETAAAGDRIISTLPVGFHAKAVQRYACVFMDGASGFAFASPYGAIGVYAYSPTRDVCLQLDFEAS